MPEPRGSVNWRKGQFEKKSRSTVVPELCALWVWNQVALISALNFIGYRSGANLHGGGEEASAAFKHV